MQSLQWRFALAALLSFVSVALSAETEPAPMIVEPSQYWEGNDGPWSTFSMQVGSTKNVSRVLVSTLIPNQWVVLDQACNTTACADSRGASLFNPNKSSTWQDKGLFNLWYESNLNYTGNGDYGFDTIGVGLSPSNASTATNQLVVGIIQDDFWLGYIGVNPQETNLTNFDHPIPSLLQTFRDNKAIPSLSFSYTAGAKYRNKGVFGQLILGGYDTSRFQSNSLDFNMADDITRDLVVGVQSLQSQEKSGKVTNLLNEGILAFVDSSVPWIVLPDDACDTIEQTFGIVQDNTTGLYLISDAQHSALTSRNPNFTFVLGNNANGGNTLPITLPYSAFDLQLGSPYVSKDSRYFPLKRGNDTSYTLGRAFLQEAYLTANYEHQNFSISQATFDDSAKISIQPVHALGWVAPAGSGSTGDSTSSGSSGYSSGVSTGTIVGIVVAVVLIIIAIATLALLRHLRRWPFHHRTPLGVTELDADGNAIGHEKDSVALLSRLHNRKQPHTTVDAVEADSKNNLSGYYRPELAGQDGTMHKSELPGMAVHRPGDRNELPGSHAGAEVEGSPGIVMELAGSPVGQEYFRQRQASEPVSAVSNQSLHPRSPAKQATASPGRSPISPRRGSELSPNNDHLRPGSRGAGRTPISPQSGGSEYSVSQNGSRAGSSHSQGHSEQRWR